jgi:hypothetical protein
VLALQQLHRNLRNIGRGAIYFPSYDLVPTAGGRLRTCEVDFSMILTRVFPNKSEVIIGECKDEGGTIDLVDVENLQCIADLLPARRFEAYIVFAKLAPFTLAEIALAKTLNGPHQQRVILLTPRELEPQDIFERISKELGIESPRRTLEELARLTHRIYFTQRPASAHETSA